MINAIEHMQEAKCHLEINLSVKCFDFGEALELEETFESSDFISELCAAECVWSVVGMYSKGDFPPWISSFLLKVDFSNTEWYSRYTVLFPCTVSSERHSWKNSSA